MLIRQLLFITLIVSFFTGCGSTPTPSAKKQKTIPTWVNAPAPTDSQFIYGIALQENRDDAIHAALNDMVAKLGISLESSYESNEEVSGYYSESTIKNKIKADIAKIKINNYEVVKSEKISYREFAVMIKTDKQKFFRGIVEDLDLKQKSIQNRYNTAKSKDALSRYNEVKKLSEEAKGLVSSILIAYELNPAFDKLSYLGFVEKLEKAYNGERKTLNFYVTGDKKSRKFVSSVKNYLAHAGFQVTETRKKNIVNVKLNTRDNISGGSIRIAVLNLDIKVYDGSQRIGGKNVILKERYNGSFASVYKNAAIHLEQDIKSQGINEVIGIDLDTSK